MNRIKITIMDSTYVITTSEEESYLHDLASKLNNQLQEMMENNTRLSLTDALVLCSINYLDLKNRSEESADNMRSQLAEYLEDAARARIELEEANREVLKLKRSLEALSGSEHA